MTMNGWDYAKELTKRHSEGAGIFVQLKDDGDSVTGVLCGEPDAREVVWIEGAGYESFDAQKHAGMKKSLRVAFNLYDLADGRMKVIEGGAQWFKNLLAVRAKFDLQQWSIEITRNGAARDPKTSYSILPHQQIDAATRAKIAASQLHDLVALAADKGTTTSAAPAANRSTASASHQAISDDDALRLVERLKALPRAALDEFLRETKVSKIRELTTATVGAAERFLAQLEAAYATDPFGP